jgi:hypothetical protein
VKRGILCSAKSFIVKFLLWRMSIAAISCSSLFVCLEPGCLDSDSPGFGQL